MAPDHIGRINYLQFHLPLYRKGRTNKRVTERAIARVNAQLDGKA